MSGCSGGGGSVEFPDPLLEAKDTPYWQTLNWRPVEPAKPAYTDEDNPEWRGVRERGGRTRYEDHPILRRVQSRGVLSDEEMPRLR